MSLLFYLPLICGVSFIVGGLFILKNIGRISFLYLLLFVLMAGIGLALSGIESLIIYKYVDLVDVFVRDNLFLFILLMVANSLSCLSKGLFVNKCLRKTGFDVSKIILGLSSPDVINICLLFVLIIKIKL